MEVERGATTTHNNYYYYQSAYKNGGTRIDSIIKTEKKLFDNFLYLRTTISTTTK